jgi:hypothetical protein
MMAPTLAFASSADAVMTSSRVSAACSIWPKYRKNGARPRCDNARRMSDWNSTIPAITTYASTLRINQPTVRKGNTCETYSSRITTTEPIAICIARVPRISFSAS